MGSSEHEAQSSTRIVEWIIEARAGSAEALARLLEFSRQYLLLIANDEWPANLQAKAGASDLVQETQLEAVRAFADFRGHTAAELLAWLRQILLNNLRDFTRHFDGGKRQASREVSLDNQGTDQSNARAGADQLSADLSSPSHVLQKLEQAGAVERALGRLPEDYRRVILWHHRENCSFEEIGRRLDRSAGAARKLWARAIQQLQGRLSADEPT